MINMKLILKKIVKFLQIELGKFFQTQTMLALAPFANWPPKEWPTKNFIKIAEYLIDKGINKIYILG